jgi:hypothetical protein
VKQLQNSLFFHCFVVPEGRKVVGSPKRRVLGDQKMRATVPEAHWEVKILKIPEVRNAFLEVEQFKKCSRLGREAHFEVKTYKTHHVWSTFGS